MEPESILYRTLWIFAGSFVAAVAVLGVDRLVDDAKGQGAG